MKRELRLYIDKRHRAPDGLAQNNPPTIKHINKHQKKHLQHIQKDSITLKYNWLRTVFQDH